MLPLCFLSCRPRRGVMEDGASTTVGTWSPSVAPTALVAFLRTRRLRSSSSATSSSRPLSGTSPRHPCTNNTSCPSCTPSCTTACRAPSTARSLGTVPGRLAASVRRHQRTLVVTRAPTRTRPASKFSVWDGCGWNDVLISIKRNQYVKPYMFPFVRSLSRKPVRSSGHLCESSVWRNCRIKSCTSWATQWTCFWMMRWAIIGIDFDILLL